MQFNDCNEIKQLDPEHKCSNEQQTLETRMASAEDLINFPVLIILAGYRKERSLFQGGSEPFLTQISSSKPPGRLLRYERLRREIAKVWYV